uniref:Uncharacterized protein n=1 Tax=Hirsutella vermicola TaxID=369263 RepID=A0A1S6KM33_9HYPO|nr:hypothetical protein [Hirsutella vermicola]AQT19624.1 hypothetical protein [Hirsutella vermicola]
MVNNSDTNFIKAFLTLCIFYFKFPLYGIFDSINWQLLNEDWKSFQLSKHFCVENFLKYFTLCKIISFTFSTLLGLGLLKFLNLNLELIWIISIIEIFILFNFSEYFIACVLKLFSTNLKDKIQIIIISYVGSTYSKLSILLSCTAHWVAHVLKYTKNIYKICKKYIFNAYPSNQQQAKVTTLKSASAGGGWLSIIQQIENEPKQNNSKLIVPSELVDKYFLMETTAFMKTFEEENQKIANLFKKMSDANIDYSDKSHDLYFTFLQSHVNALNISYTNRDGWVMLCAKYFSPEVKSKLIDMEAKRETIRNNYLSKIEKLGYNKSSFREFVTITNNYRNNLNKELNLAEELVHNNLRKTNIYKDSQVKKFVNSDYVEAKKIFKNQDTILKKKFEEKLFKS